MPIDLEPGQRIPMSWDEYERLGPENRGEYVDGEFVVSPLPSGHHQDACYRMARRISETVPEGVRVRLSWGWKTGPDEFGPDVTVFDETEEDLRYTGIPYLCVEVLSTDRAADLVRKFAKYAAAGLPRYWVVDLDVPEVIAFEQGQDGGFRETQRLRGAEAAELDVGPSRVTITPAELLA